MPSPKPKPKVRPKYAGVIPSLRADIENPRMDFKSFARKLGFFLDHQSKVKSERRTKSELHDDYWPSSGRIGVSNYFEGFEVGVLEVAKQKLRLKKKLKILELGMGYGQHVPEFVKELQDAVPDGKIEYHDLSLTKYISEKNKELLELEKRGIVKRHVGNFAIRPVDDLRDCDLVISIAGPFTHTNAHYIPEMLEKLTSTLAVGGDAFILGLPFIGYSELRNYKKPGFTIKFISNRVHIHRNV